MSLLLICATPQVSKGSCIILQENIRIKTLVLNDYVANLNIHLPLPLTHFLCTQDSILNDFILSIIAFYYVINLHVSITIIFNVLSISITKTVTIRWFTRHMTTPIAKRLIPHQGRVSRSPSSKSPNLTKSKQNTLKETIIINPKKAHSRTAVSGECDAQ